MRLFLLVVSLISVIGCSEPPAFDVGAARSAVRRAIRVVYANAPAEAHRLEGLVSYAEVATGRDGATLLSGRTAPAAWERAVRECFRSVASIRRTHMAEEATWRDAEATAAAGVGRATAEIEEAGMSLREAMAYQRSRAALGVARRYAVEGAFRRAALKAGEALVDAEAVHRKWLSLHERFGDPSWQRRWQGWVEETLSESRRQGRKALVADKRQRRLDVYDRGRLVASFEMELGANGLSPKRHSGDRATPEGRYKVVKLKNSGQTRYHKALLLDYPNGEDLQRYHSLRRQGAIPRGAGPGSLIEIHGDGGKGKDWTDGCIALTNTDMDKLFRMVDLHTPVTIVGSYRRDGAAR